MTVNNASTDHNYCQAFNIDKRAEMAEEEQEAAVKKMTGKKVKKSDAWFQITNSPEFPTHGKIGIRSQFRKYLDCNKKFAEADAAAPVFWHVHPPRDKSKESFKLAKKTKVLMGAGGDVMVFPDPCNAEWKALMKVPGQYMFMNEEGKFLLADKDGTVSCVGCNHEDPIDFKRFLFHVKPK